MSLLNPSDMTLGSVKLFIYVSRKVFTIYSRYVLSSPVRSFIAML